jgi:hypothetical protein
MNENDIIQDFLDKGGNIEIVPPVEIPFNKAVGSLTKKQTTLMTLEEAEYLYGEKSRREVKVKKPNLTGINMELIPEYLKRLILSKQDNDNTKEEI